LAAEAESILANPKARFYALCVHGMLEAVAVTTLMEGGNVAYLSGMRVSEEMRGRRFMTRMAEHQLKVIGLVPCRAIFDLCKVRRGSWRKARCADV
jgi:hypothetical protein